MAERILILGGTKEAAALSETLVLEYGPDAVTTSLAGRTKEPKPVAGQVRIGGFGGAQGLANYMLGERITRLIDATHPFATHITENAKRASEATGIPLEIHHRSPWIRQAGDAWIEVKDLAAARDAVPAGAHVLLAIGAQHMDVFRGITNVQLLARTVDGPSAGETQFVDAWIVGRPSPDWREEASLMQQHRITHIVCRNSGGTGAYAKIEAARHLGLPVIMVQRPVNADV